MVHILLSASMQASQAALVAMFAPHASHTEEAGSTSTFRVEDQWAASKSGVGRRGEGLEAKDPNRKPGSALPGCATVGMVLKFSYSQLLHL